MGHLCHALECPVSVPPRMFMCSAHWRLVPKIMQNAIWAAYVPGQERRKDPTSEYIDAAMRAVDYVWQLETEILEDA